ncbi:MAG: hypothetical protein AAB400_04480 [Patescibacteria group bacterium]
MNRASSHTRSIVALFVIALLIFAVLLIWNKYPFSVKRYKTIELGLQSAEKVGDSTGWAPPYDKVPEESDFFVYSLGEETMCIGSDCGVGGYFIECLGGWISGYRNIGEVADYGLRDAGININTQRVITIADKDGSIVGIYPGARIKNLPYIMRNHRKLISVETFNTCSDMMPSRWR